MQQERSAIQRIVVQRELARMRLAASDSVEIDSISKYFLYAGMDTCATDGLCATACPVGINTGDYIRRLRTDSITNEKPALWIANNFAVAEKTIGWGVRMDVAEKVVGVNGVKSVSVIAQKLTGGALPKWNRHIPSHSPFKRGAGGEVDFIYFPSCISRQLGTPKHDVQLYNNDYCSLPETFIARGHDMKSALL